MSNHFIHSMFKVNYQTLLPLRELSPTVTIRNGIYHTYRVDFLDGNKLIKSEICKNNSSVYGNRQWYTNWVIKIYSPDNKLIYLDKFDLNNKVIFIKIDAYALGDNIAWFPYINEFRKKHNCKIICSTFFNWLFEKEYPDIMFVNPNTYISNIYAQYYIGSNGTLNHNYSPSTHLNIPLQKVSSDILGLEFKEIRPNVSHYIANRPTLNKYVCISEHASFDIKKWHEPNGWQTLVDFLKNKGYDVVVISKEPTTLNNIIDKTGNIELKYRPGGIGYQEAKNDFDSLV